MKKRIAIFGGGPAAMGLAYFLNSERYDVIIYEQNKTCGRKFLVAGKGGFNLTHGEPLEQLKSRYLPKGFLDPALDAFTNGDLRSWMGALGIETFVGSSGRVFPISGIKPIQVLGTILEKLDTKGIQIMYNKQWSGWSAAHLPIVNEGEEVEADYYVYALGGASWKVTGSSGAWASHFADKGVVVLPFESSNCAYNVPWSSSFLEGAEGQPLKNIAVRCGDKIQKGELVITKFGLEGNGIYALSPKIRKELYQAGEAIVYIDLKPTLDMGRVKARLLNSRSKKVTETLKNDIKLNKVQVLLLKEYTSRAEFLDLDKLALAIKGLPIKITGLAPLDEAISTVGGVSTQALDRHFQLKQLNNSFCIGEMVDWDAPTGGYLLQGCISMGAYLAKYLNTKDLG